MSEDTTQEGTQETEASQVVNEIVTEQADENQWFMSTDAPGTGEKPEWFKDSKYKTVADQAEAYTALESRFGAFSGAPDDYTVNLSDELKEKGVEIGEDDVIMEEAIKFAKESNMSQDGFDNMVNLYAMSKLAEGSAIEDHRAEQFKALGPNAQTRIDNIVAWGNKNLSEDMVAGLEDMATTAAAVETIEHLVSLTRGSALTPDNTNPTTPTSAEEVRKMQFEKDEHGNRRIQTDPEFKARYDKLKNEVWGAEPQRIIIGK
jgi:hypothetical protein